MIPSASRKSVSLPKPVASMSRQVRQARTILVYLFPILFGKRSSAILVKIFFTSEAFLRSSFSFRCHQYPVLGWVRAHPRLPSIVRKMSIGLIDSETVNIVLHLEVFFYTDSLTLGMSVQVSFPSCIPSSISETISRSKLFKSDQKRRS